MAITTVAQAIAQIASSGAAIALDVFIHRADGIMPQLGLLAEALAFLQTNGAGSPLAAAKVTGAGAISQSHGFAGIVKNGNGDITLQLSAAIADTTKVCVLATINEIGLPMTIGTTFVDATHIRVLTKNVADLVAVDFSLIVLTP